MVNPLDKEYYWGIVDIGSNGIRFSISDLAPATARVLPTIFQDRCAISLYDAQYVDGEKVPLPDATIRDIVTALLKFRSTCSDFGVPDNHVKVVATEAARTAINSQQLITEIETSLQWKPELVSKDEEANLGVMGVASSVQNPEGLVLDMGGGSVQITYLAKAREVIGETGGRKFVSFPLGAAALMARLSESSSTKEDPRVYQEVLEKVSESLEDMNVPRQGSLTIYFTGGGLRAWAHILMSIGPLRPYPIPIVNGYCVSRSRLLAGVDDSNFDSKIHRVSKRRVSQVKAVHLLIRALLQALEALVPSCSFIFCQGGVREGILYSQLPEEIKQQQPLVAATVHYAPPSATKLLAWLKDAVPEESLISDEILKATINLLYAHASYPKDIRSSAALRCTTTGALSAAHGLMHYDRALLGLSLSNRWGADTPKIDIEFQEKLQALIGSRMSWWAKYVGWATACLAGLSPAGFIHPNESLMRLQTSLLNDHPKLGAGMRSPGEAAIGDDSTAVLRVKVIPGCSQDIPQGRTWVEKVKQLAKKKHFRDEESDWRVKIEASLLGETQEIVP